MTEPSSPAARALLDQVGVAARDGSAMMVALAGQFDAVITEGVGEGPVTELIRGFVRRYLTGGVGHCPHGESTGTPPDRPMDRFDP